MPMMYACLLPRLGAQRLKKTFGNSESLTVEVPAKLSKTTKLPFGDRKHPNSTKSAFFRLRGCHLKVTQEQIGTRCSLLLRIWPWGLNCSLTSCLHPSGKQSRSERGQAGPSRCLLGRQSRFINKTQLWFPLRILNNYDH